MDRVIEKKRWSRKRIFTFVGIGLLVTLLFASYYFTSGGSKLNVKAERLSIGVVQEGSFKEFIPVNGIVMPQTTIYLDAVEGGRVEEKFVEDGAMMKKGEPIMRLSNTDLELGLVTQQTQVYNLLTQMQISKNAAEQNTVSKMNQLADVESQFREAERIYILYKKLYEQKVIAQQEFLEAKNRYEYLLEKKKLSRRIMSQDSVNTIQQVRQAQKSFEGSQFALEVMRQKVEDLIVRAPVDGQLTSLDAEVGQQKIKGQRLGQIDVMDGFKVRADIDEHYITRIFPGLRGEVEIGNKSFGLEIKKVYSQVSNGRFQVDMEFDATIPQNIRRGQSLQLRLALSDATTAVLIPRGGFYQQTGGNWIFKVSKDGKTAYKTPVRLGRQNPNHYEVLEGLAVGDKVITSSYEDFGNHTELQLKK